MRHGQRYEVNASHEHNRKVLEGLQSTQEELIRRGLLEAPDKFKAEKPTEIKFVICCQVRA